MIRHEDLLHQLGTGRNFSEQNEALVIEMTRKLLDYTKSARLDAADPSHAEQKQPEAEADRGEIRMTTDGYPIIPKVVMDKDLKKGDWEKLLCAFLIQHYCECHFRYHG